MPLLSSFSYSSLSPTSIPPSALLPITNKPYGFCGFDFEAPCSLTQFTYFVTFFFLSFSSLLCCPQLSNTCMCIIMYTNNILFCFDMYLTWSKSTRKKFFQDGTGKRYYTGRVWLAKWTLSSCYSI